VDRLISLIQHGLCDRAPTICHQRIVESLTLHQPGKTHAALQSIPDVALELRLLHTQSDVRRTMKKVLVEDDERNASLR
jgi:hypothetical protein